MIMKDRAVEQGWIAKNADVLSAMAITVTLYAGIKTVGDGARSLHAVRSFEPAAVLFGTESGTQLEDRNSAADNADNLPIDALLLSIGAASLLALRGVSKNQSGQV